MVRRFILGLPGRTLFQVAFDLVLLCVSLVLALAWLDRGDLGRIAAALPWALPFALAVMALHGRSGAHGPDAGGSLTRISATVILCFLVSTPMAYGMSSLVPPPPPWRGPLGLAVLPVLVLMVAVRGYVLRAGFGTGMSRRVMVMGTGAEAAAVERSLSRSGLNVQFVGFYPVRSDEGIQVARERVLTDGMSLPDTSRSLGVDEIVVALRERRTDAVSLRELLDCKLAGVRVLDLPSYFEEALGQLRLDSLGAGWLIFGAGFRQGTVRKLVKRLFDLVAATLLLVLLWPVILLSAILIVLESGFPVFYRQERVGQGGRSFTMIKLRSMRRDAELNGTPRWAACNDERATRVGRTLRRLRIDELPQLWNVLKGEMSLVGPRPERPCFVTQLTREIPFYAARHSVKPGVTGWAQVRYPYGESVEDAAQKLQYDLYYVKNHALLLDTVIVFLTVRVVLTGAGAR